MSNIVEFVVKMRDLMSSGLGRLSSTSRSSFNTMAQQADRMNQRNRVLGQSYDELQRQIREVENTVRTSTIPNQISAARRELASLQRMAGRHQGNINNVNSGGGSRSGIGIGGVAIGSALGGMAMQAGTAVLEVIKSGIGGAISGSLKKETAITGLSTFIGKDQAELAYKNIRHDADISPYGTESLLEVNRALISAGLNAKDAREDTMNLANAISAVGGSDAELSRMAANMQQIKTVGKATAQDIKQFGMVGINIYEALARSTGKSITQVKEMDVTYNQLAKAFALARGKGGLYEGALEAQGNTKEGKWNTVKDKLSNALVDIGDAFSPVINKVLDVGIKIAEKVSPLLQQAQPYIDMISSGLGKAIDYVLSLKDSTGGWMDYVYIIADIIGIIWDYNKKLLTNIFKIVGGVLEWLKKSELVKDAFRLIGWFLENVISPFVTSIGDSLLWIWENVLKPILGGLEDAYKLVKEKLGFGDDNKIVIEVNKTTLLKDLPLPPDPKNYFTDLTRFGEGKNSSITDLESNKSKNKTQSKATGDTISGGGPKTINITVGKFFDSIQFTTMNNEESREKLEALLMELMGRVLFNGAKTL